MRHRIRSRKLGRTSAHRLSLYRNMVTSLLEHERIQTTDAKAKEVRRWAERMITLGKRGTLHARRRALRVIRRREVAAKVFDELAQRYRDRPGGYTRVVKLRNRLGDAAAVSIVELVEAAGDSKPEEEKPSRRKAARKKAEAKGAAPARKKTGAKKGEAKGAAPARKKTGAKKGEAKGAAPARKKTGTKKSTAEEATAKKKTRRKPSRSGA